MKRILTVALALLSAFIQAQNAFIPISPKAPTPQFQTEFLQTGQSSAAAADVNGDGFVDIFMTGTTLYGSRPILYLNNGLGDLRPDFENDFLSGFANSSNIVFADVDNDGDPDLFYRGYDEDDTYNLLYLNDGEGNFSLVENNGLLPLSGSISHTHFCELNGDGLLDLVQMGAFQELNGERTRVYINQGDGTFDLLEDAGLENLTSGAIASADVDGDGDLDIFLTGRRNWQEKTSLWHNDGTGHFTLFDNTTFFPLMESFAQFSDLDLDGDFDIFYGGRDGDDEKVRIYMNDGNSNFTNAPTVVSQGIFNGKMAFGDFDDDGDDDLVLTGIYDNQTARTKLFQNNAGQFAENDFTYQFVNSFNGEALFLDSDGDGDLDLLITGTNTNLYINDGDGNYAINRPSTATPMTFSESLAADFNGDGHLDLLRAGQTDKFGVEAEVEFLELLPNNGSGRMIPNPTLADSVFWYFDLDRELDLATGDIDNDGDIDFILTSGEDHLIALNDGTANFDLSPLFLPASYQHEVDLIDMNSDGHLDLCLIGAYTSESNAEFLCLFNDGTGQFDESYALDIMSNPQFHEAFYGDINGDGHTDFLFSSKQSSNPYTVTYLNQGDGTFVIQDDITFENLRFESARFIDLDNDGDNDLIAAGDSTTGTDRIWQCNNDGEGNFSVNSIFSSPFNGYTINEVGIGDLNGDGFPDLINPARRNESSSRGSFYLNDGNGNLILQADSSILAITAGSVICEDFTGDDHIDLFINGENPSSLQPSAKLYRNILSIQNCGVQANCRNIQVELDANDQILLSPAMINDGSLANCGISASAVVPEVLGVEALDTAQPVQLFITNTQGNVSSCTAQVLATPFCGVNGGVLQTDESTSLCLDGGTPVSIDLNPVQSIGNSRIFILSDENGEILDFRNSNSLFAMEEYPADQYEIRMLMKQGPINNTAGITHVDQLDQIQGCLDFSDNVVVVNLVEKPEPSVLSVSDANLCPGETINMNSSGGSGGTRRYALIGQGNIYEVNWTGTFSTGSLDPGLYQGVHIRYQQGTTWSDEGNNIEIEGCYALSNAVPIVLADCIGESGETDVESAWSEVGELKVYPNPSSGNLFFEWQGEYINPRYVIYDAVGKMVEEGNLNAPLKAINIGHPGSYLLVIYDGQRMIKSQKVMIF